MPNCRERIVVIEDFDEREIVVREPAAELEFRGCGPARGAYEDQVRAANDVRVEYEPPRRGRAA